MARLCVLVVVLSLPHLASGQSAGVETNMDVLSRLATSCLPETEGQDALTLATPSRLPFLGSALVSVLASRGLRVLAVTAELAEAEMPPAARMDVDLERAGVTYERAGSGWLTRTVNLGLTVRLTGADREILHDALCTPSATDRVRTGAIPGLEESAYPETRGTVPLSLWRRAVQPAMITLATAAGTVLFFSLRSRRSDGS